jgi:hypothetical protein
MIHNMSTDHNGTLKWIHKNIKFSHHNIANIFTCIHCVMVIGYKIHDVMLISVVELHLMHEMIISV